MRAGGTLVGWLWLALLATSACGGGTGAGATETDPPVIVATTTIVGDLAALVAGQEASVEVLMPIGADPAAYEPTPAQTRRLLEADLVVASGLGLEAGLAEALSDAERRGVPVLRLGEYLCPIDGGEGTDETCDPYWWMDPLRAAGAVGLIADHLIPIRDGEWIMRALEADRRLSELDSMIRIRLSLCESWPRQLVTSQLGLGYFAERYDCLVTPPGAAPAESPSPSSAGRGAGSITVFIDSLGGPGSGAETYADMMLTNADRIAHAGPVAFVQRAPTEP